MRSLFIAGFVALGAWAGADETANVAWGVFVESLPAGSPAERAGLRVGDLLTRWERQAAPPANPQAARGGLHSPFDLGQLVVEEAPRGRVTLFGRRGGDEISIVLAPVDWKVGVRAVLPEALLGLYEDGRARISSGEVEAGVALWREAAERLREVDGAAACWLRLRLAESLTAVGQKQAADRAWGDALAAAPGPRERALVLEAQTRAQKRSGEYDGAVAAATEALAIRRERGEMVSVATRHADLGEVAWFRRDLAGAEREFQRALALREAHAPDSILPANTLSNLAVAAWSRGDLARAEELDRRALAVAERLFGSSPSLAPYLLNLGVSLRARGQLAAAEDLYLKVLEVWQQHDPGGGELARPLLNLANLAYDRGDVDGAEGYAKRALAVFEAARPESLDAALASNNLGRFALERGDLAAAEAHHRRALAIREREAPNSADVAMSLNNLGVLAHRRGDLVAAESHLRRAIAIEAGVAPGGLVAAIHFEALGDVAADRGDLRAAREHLRNALSIRERLAPGSGAEADAVYKLARLARREGGMEEAAALFARALETLDEQRGRLGGSHEARAGFSARYAAVYHDAIDVLWGLGRMAEAFDVVERSRAQAFLALLAERDLSFSADLPDDLLAEKRAIEAEYDQVLAELGRTPPDQADAVLARQKELWQGLKELAARIRAVSPRLAALRYPEPLDLAHTRAALDPGTVLLSYVVGRERSLLFAVEALDPSARGPRSKGVSVFAIPAGAEALRERVQALRELLRRPRPAQLGALRDEARGLYDLLVRPAQDLVASSDRILVSADGPLHFVPFGALLGAPGAGGAARHLAEWKPVHVVASATVYAELKSARKDRPAAALVAFADPRYLAAAEGRAASVPDPELRSLLTRGADLRPLPASREEVEAIARLYPGATLHLGPEASEARAKALGKDVRYLHFACHALLDERRPLDSALALSTPEAFQPGQDNGLLQAWEIFEYVRIDADLVTLSACDTGMGTAVSGEGLVGLSRAFQHAGARSLLVSLWAVADTSTAALMTRFYGHLRDGKAKDEALRAAQLELMAEERWSHPFHWAAFQLIGDWR